MATTIPQRDLRNAPDPEVIAQLDRVDDDIRADGRARRVRYAPVDSLIGATARVHGRPLSTRDAGMVGRLGVDIRVV